MFKTLFLIVYSVKRRHATPSMKPRRDARRTESNFLPITIQDFLKSLIDLIKTLKKLSVKIKINEKPPF